MTATIKTMKFVYADLLTPSQLMPGDYINIENNIVEVIDVVDDALGDVYTITYSNDFSERETFDFAFDEQIPMYVFVDTDE